MSERGRGRGARPRRRDERTHVVALGEVPERHHHPDQEADPEALHHSPPPPPLASAARVLTIVPHAALGAQCRAGSKYCSTASFRSTARRASAHCPSATARACAQPAARPWRSEEHTSELQSRGHLVCRLLLEKKK